MEEKQKLIKNCIEWANKAEEILECPVCLKSNGNMIQCRVGHFICEFCSQNLHVYECPICRQPLSNIKCYIVDDLTKTLNNLKISLNNLDKDFQPDKKLENNKKLMRQFFTELSNFFNLSSNVFTYINKYLDSSDSTDRNELKKQMTFWTTKCCNLKKLVTDVTSSFKATGD